MSILLAFILSVLVSWCIIPRVILISFKKNLFDATGGRKVHKGCIPRLGGVAFTPALVMSLALVFVYSLLFDDYISIGDSDSLQVLLCVFALLILYSVGVTDDVIGVGYKLKFLVQLVSSVLVVASGLWINNFFGLFGVYELPWYVGQPFSVLLIMYIINALNLIDGIDGLASGLGMVALMFVGSLFKVQGDLFYAVVAFAMLGALIPFFFYNVFGSEDRRSKIFMGDCGSLVLGLILGILGIRFCLSSEADSLGGEQPFIVAFSALLIPCFDVVRVMFGRLRRGENPFLPDKTHIHHKFLALGMSQTTDLVTILTLDACFILFNVVTVGKLDINIIFAADIVLYTVLHVWLSMVVRRKQSLESTR